MLFNHLAFGASSPVSGQVKRWWGSHSINVYTGAEITKLDFFGISPETEYNTMPQLTNWVRSFSGIVFEQNPWKPGWQYRYSWTFFYLFVLTVIVFSFNRAYISRAFTSLSLLFLFAASGLQIFSYNAGGYAGVKEWYWAAQYILFILFCAVLIDFFAQHLLRLKGGAVFLWLVAISLSVLRADQFISRVNSTLSYRTNSVDTPYTEAVSFLEEHTPPSSLIGMTGGGNVGYFIHDRTIINMDGLINSPQYFKALQSQSADNFLADIGLDYIFANPDILNSVPYRSQFNNLYEKDIARFGGKVLIEIKQDLK